MRSLLSRTGFKGDSQGFLRGGHKFLQRHLPSLLHRDAWEKVTGQFPLQYYWHILYFLYSEIPPSRVSINLRRNSRYLATRTAAVLLHHELVFRDDSSNPTDNMFWETLYIGALDKSWRIVDQRALQLRFGWVLDYIRTGSLSPEAQRAK